VKKYIWNKMLFLERENKGYYAGFTTFEYAPLFRNDDNKGFFMWLFFRCGWYPVNKFKG
jgi:hypothetical protein